MQAYLGRENIAILEEEIAAFKVRLDHWKGSEASQQWARTVGNRPIGRRESSPRPGRAGSTLAGEDETSRHLDDAIHWVKVYSELLELSVRCWQQHSGTS